MKQKFLVVFYEWFMDRGHFSQEVIERDNKKEVEEYAQSKAFKKQSTFNHCNVTVIELSKI